MLQEIKNWLIHLLGGYTKNSYYKFIKQLEWFENENQRLKRQSVRCEYLLVEVVSSFHNFNYSDENEFADSVRTIISNIRLLTCYARNQDRLSKLENEEFEELINLIDKVLHQAIRDFKADDNEFKKFDLFFKQIQEKYQWNFIKRG